MKTIREANRFLLLVLGITAAACALTTALGSHLIYNWTNSLPVGWYWLERGASPNHGELAAVPVPAEVRALVLERGYLPSGAFLVKPVVAMAGDHVCIDEEFRVNGRSFGRVLERDARGRELPQHRGCEVVSPGQVYIASNQPNSFDSRVFGPVSNASVRGKVSPLLTW